MTRNMIQIGDHESNLDKTAKLEWHKGSDLSAAVYSCRKGFVAIRDGMAFEGHFSTLQEAKVAAQEAAQ